MDPPPRTIRSEAAAAIALGIRERGPEAIGMLLIGLVRITLAVVVLAVLLLLQLFGISTVAFSLESIPFATVSVISVALSVMATLGRHWGEEDSSQVTTEDGNSIPGHLGQRARP